MEIILILLSLLLSFVLLIPSIVLWVECMAALTYKSSTSITHLTRPDNIAVLIPAHNEEATISTTINAILPQITDSDRLIVIADNCSDNTAKIAQELGAIVIERENQEKRGKGYALAFGVRFLRSYPPNVVTIIDADCIIEPGSLEKLASMAVNTGQPIQANYLMTQPPNPNTKDIISALAFLVKNQVRFTGLAQIGLPCLLAGTGMAFPWTIIRDAPLATGNIVEDMQLGIDLAISGALPKFCPDAKVISSLPQQQEAATTQRSRWEQGHIQTLITQVPRLLKEAIFQRRYQLFTLALELAVPPLSLLVIFWILSFIFVLILAIFFKFWISLIILLLSGFLIFIAIFTAWYKFGHELIPAMILWKIPVYLLWKIPLYISALIKPEKQWIKTKRDS